MASTGGKATQLATDFADRNAVVLPKVRHGLEVRRQPACQPDQFEIPSCFALEAATRLNSIQVPVDVKLEQGRRMICRSAHQRGRGSLEAKTYQVKLRTALSAST
jgi:hypothetical protein